MKRGLADQSNRVKIGKKLFDPGGCGVFKYHTLPGAISIVKLCKLEMSYIFS